MKDRTSFPIVVISTWFLLCSAFAHGQDTYNVLFLGNSYTGSNDLPQLVHDVALSAGDTLVYDSNTPGGFQLLNHASNATTQNKIMAGEWNYVVMQGQSQEPITFPGDFNNGATALYDDIKEHNPCAVVMPFMTWGRENGDASNCLDFPNMCTYLGMDTDLRDRYLDITDAVSGEVSPVSVVWRYIRQNHPSIDLYTADGSHPSVRGSYAAACCFYAAIFKKDPEMITFDFVLDPDVAATIRMAAKTQVFDQLSDWDLKKPPLADILFTTGPGDLDMQFISFNPGGLIQDVLWDFGDGNTISTVNPAHTYASNGTYTVQLTATTCDIEGPHTAVADTTIQLCDHAPSIFSSQTSLCSYDTLETQEADSYQWYSGFNAISGQTNQYLADYSQYNNAGVFSVMSTMANCAEISQFYNPNPIPLMYYFDAVGSDPCEGDTTLFIVHKFGDVLSGSEIIHWYQDGDLLPSMSNEDTLLITGPGIYECSVVDPLAICPFDTTFSSVIDIECPVGFDDYSDDEKIPAFSIFPNPASKTITVEFTRKTVHERLQVYDLMGRVLIEQIAIRTSVIDVSGLSRGMYLIRLEGSTDYEVRFIKQ